MAPPPHVRRAAGSGGGGAAARPPRAAAASASASASAATTLDAGRAAREKAYEAVRQQRLLNPVNYKHNVGVVYFLRIYMTIVAGAVVGILGVTGWAGFAAYLLSQALCAAPIVALALASEREERRRRRRRQQQRRPQAPGAGGAGGGAGAQPPPPPGPPPLSPAPLACVVPRCFQAWPQVLTEHVFGQVALLSFLLCWMVWYNIAHVF